ncbi:hypothetical protein DTO012A7_8966 [Penicillium roqueforti]|uniref:uncharacterized protein n=1 Tax=Penicillium roqueforti TaxID=5082 RepID=UPI00190BEF8A|nr:uncharacterized protein LCP9604111_9466 [Penicillium roqueforti]KAF9238440.1 hypothetical protein LCP9604111_9466 [Penicillium roqueforti]KAI2695006.1 hypothetical protein CBS147372_9480 [Penicillium roqueforti]KAI3103094.1 hypothetical protein CBS147333_7698 [Penicillium roqueforti]KAI3194623.1 hypothetical protein CBS147311_8528 [Penicillium roqueforti]KAI3222100.1 hypothetical protein DTO012A7_8966 [Penicillium roqueforti]
MEPAPEEANPASKPPSPHPDIQPDPALQPETETDTDNANDDPTKTDSHDDQSQSSPSSTSRPLSAVVPPYWRRHERDASHVSQASLRGATITLEDHTTDPNSETSRGLWASSVTIDDHVVVRGMTGVGSYVVWNCTIQTLDGGPIVVRMRYSEFDDLRQRLVASFPHARSALPALPPKSIIFKFRPSFLESRRVGLEYFLNCVLLNPEFSGSPIVKDFLFGRIC